MTAGIQRLFFSSGSLRRFAVSISMIAVRRIVRTSDNPTTRKQTPKNRNVHPTVSGNSIH